MSSIAIASPRASARTVALCFAAAVFEGVDIQSMGVAAPRLGPEFHLDPAQIGLAASASVLGLLIGASFGGWLSDRIGRRWVLIGAMLGLGVFTLATAFAWDFTSLLWIRVAAGLGLGGAMPALIALSAEAAPPDQRGTAVSLMYCGLPVGGVAVSLLSATLSAPADWRLIFYFGGLGPLLLAPLMLAGLTETRPRLWPVNDGTSSRTVSLALFGGGRAASTLLMWVAFFFTLVVLYVLLNWLPSLVGAKGFSKPQGALASMLLSAGGGVGVLAAGRLMDRGHLKRLILVIYGGLTLALAILALAGRFELVALGAFLAGMFSFGAQLVLYAMTPGYYPPNLRGTGVGAAVAVGRLGSIAGPIAAGQILASGLGSNAVLVAFIPGLALALGTALALQSRKPLAG
jgi:AAHS family 3-hydroxyphenylpropionic acid transporter